MIRDVTGLCEPYATATSKIFKEVTAVKIDQVKPTPQQHLACDDRTPSFIYVRGNIVAN